MASRGDSKLMERALAANAQARAQREAGDADLACYLYAHSLEWSETAEARLGLAWAHGYAGRLEAAAAEAAKAVALDPEDGRASNDLGVYLMQQGLDDEAIPHLQRAAAAAMNSERHFPHYNLGRIHERRQEFEAAASSYEAALRGSPDFGAAFTALERVRRKVKGS